MKKYLVLSNEKKKLKKNIKRLQQVIDKIFILI